MKKILTTLMALISLTTAYAAEPNIQGPTDKQEPGIQTIKDGKVTEFRTEGGIATASTDLIQINPKDTHRITVNLPSENAWTKNVEITFVIKDGQPIVIGASSTTHKVFVAGTAKDQFRLILNKDDGTTQKHDLPLTTMKEKIDGLKIASMKPNYNVYYRAMQPSTTSTSAPSGTTTGS